MKATILIVEDDPLMLNGLIDNLNYEGYQLLTATDGLLGLELAAKNNIDLMLLDVQLPLLGGIKLCKQLRENGNSVPIIMLTARSKDDDKIIGLEAGADDYLTKPFSIRELLARIKSQLRRRDYNLFPGNYFCVGDSKIDFNTARLHTNGQSHDLGRSESDVLELLVKNLGRAVSRESFITTIEQGRRFTNTRTLDNFMVKLRRKIEKNPAKPQYLLTVHGVGYKLIC